MSAAVHRRSAKTPGSKAENIHMKTTNLLLHCGAAKVERDWLALMAAPRSTDTWFPIPHERLIREVETARLLHNSARDILAAELLAAASGGSRRGETQTGSAAAVR